MIYMVCCHCYYCS